MTITEDTRSNVRVARPYTWLCYLTLNHILARGSPDTSACSRILQSLIYHPARCSGLQARSSTPWQPVDRRPIRSAGFSKAEVRG